MTRWDSDREYRLRRAANGYIRDFQGQCMPKGVGWEPVDPTAVPDAELGVRFNLPTARSQMAMSILGDLPQFTPEYEAGMGRLAIGAVSLQDLLQ